jgi:Tfp pilus assembly protein PilN
MSARLGLELGPDLVRAVRLEQWGRPRVVELHWDPDNPAEMAASLLESFGPGGRIAVTLDLSYLFAKQVRLPPVSAVEKRRILMLEPERFFPVRGEELVVAARGEDNLVFAARQSSLGAWLAALEEIAPVELVEASPVSLARALGQVDPGAATILMEEKNSGVGVAEVAGGRVRRLQRLGDTAELASTVRQSEATGTPIYLRPLNGKGDWRPLADSAAMIPAPLPSLGTITSAHLAAYGAALGLGGTLDEALLPADLTRRVKAHRRRSFAFAIGATLLAFTFALVSWDGYRSRTLQRLQVEAGRIRQPAESALAVQRQIEALDQEARAVGAIDAGRSNPLAGLAALNHRLPPGSYLTALRATGNDWQIDGFAREAAPLVAQLEEDPLFDQVHFLSATSRTRMNGTLYESFSIAFRLVPAP